MGRRRARLIARYMKENGLDGWGVLGVDTNPGRREQAAEELGIETLGSLDEALPLCDAVAVCTSPLSHAGIVADALRAGKHVFSEINLVGDGYVEAMREADARGLTLFLSSTFLYRAETRWIAEAARGLGPCSYRYHIGQYLPDWHPWEDYRSFFVADARTGACREILAIELPWLRTAFGEVERVHVVRRKMSRLELPYDDSLFVTLEHEGGTVGSLQVDVVCRRAVRGFELVSEDGYVTWDGSPNGLSRLDLATGEMEAVGLYGSGAEHRDGYAAFVVEDAYYNEIAAFFDAVATGHRSAYGYAEDAATLELIDRIEGSS